MKKIIILCVVLFLLSACQNEPQTASFTNEVTMTSSEYNSMSIFGVDHHEISNIYISAWGIFGMTYETNNKQYYCTSAQNIIALGCIEATEETRSDLELDGFEDIEMRKKGMVASDSPEFEESFKKIVTKYDNTTNNQKIKCTKYGDSNNTKYYFTECKNTNTKVIFSKDSKSSPTKMHFNSISNLQPLLNNFCHRLVNESEPYNESKCISKIKDYPKMYLDATCDDKGGYFFSDLIEQNMRGRLINSQQMVNLTYKKDKYTFDWGKTPEQKKGEFRICGKEESAQCYLGVTCK